MGLGDLGSYSLSDFLLFSDRVYWRMFARYNEAMWPAQAGTIAAGVLMLLGLMKPGRWAARLTLAALSVLWMLVAWLFFFERYQTINWAAVFIALPFAFQAGLLAMLAAQRAPLIPAIQRRAGDFLVAAIFVFAVAGWPVIALFAARDWQSAEVFGIAPDPTAVATLAVAALMPMSARWLAMAVPLAWCFASGLTLYVLGAAEWFVAPALGIAAASASVGRMAPAGAINRPAA
jgi:hypothetical protein